jgi:hypothetical protein
MKKILCPMLMVLLLTAAPALAVLDAMGPVDPVNGFPVWLQDQNGRAVELCLNPNFCLFDPPIAGNVLSETIGFGPEAFWWSAEAALGVNPSVDCPTCGGALLVLAAEAAWVNEVPVAGEQFAFGRVRIRVDTPVAGDYLVIEPFGTHEFLNVPAGVRGISFSSDIGGISPDFAPILGSDIGPFLMAVDPPPPDGYLGNPFVDQTITGSPTGDNVFRVIGPAGADLDGLGNNVIETTAFGVQGKIFTGIVNAPLVVKRATYSRQAGAGGLIEATVIAESVAGARVTADFNPGPTRKLPHLGSGMFGQHFDASNTFGIPSTVLVRATLAPRAPLGIFVDLADEVVITEAVYDLSDRMLTVRATSSDEMNPPTLTVPGYGRVINGMLQKSPVFPPAEVTVNSTAGGSAKRVVQIVH